MRQQILVLYLQNSALDAAVIGWARHDGSGRTQDQPGDEDEPPYPDGVAALRDGWRLIQASPIAAHVPGSEFTTAYLKYEFFFEKLVDRTPGLESES